MTAAGHNAPQTLGTAHYPSLRGRRVFITDGATGIGAALVEAFAGQGFLAADDSRACTAQEFVVDSGWT